MHLIEAEYIKRWQEYIEELYKKDLDDSDNHNGVITTLEFQVKWALGSITRNKASEDNGILVELFQILKDDLLKCCTQYARKFGELSSGHRTGKGQFSFQSQRDNAKECSNYHAIALISHANKVMLKVTKSWNRLSDRTEL